MKSYINMYNIFLVHSHITFRWDYWKINKQLLPLLLPPLSLFQQVPLRQFYRTSTKCTLQVTSVVLLSPFYMTNTAAAIVNNFDIPISQVHFQSSGIFIQRHGCSGYRSASFHYMRLNVWFTLPHTPILGIRMSKISTYLSKTYR